MAKEETLNPKNQISQGQDQKQSYDEALANMSIEQKDNVIKQLDRQCGQFALENQKLKQQMQQMQASEFYVILDWNYKLATDKSGMFHTKFMEECAARVEAMMTPPAAEVEPNNNTENG